MINVFRYLVTSGCRSSVTGGRGRGGRGGDSFRDMGVGSVQPVGNAMVHILRLGRRIKVLHGAEIFGGDRLEGRRPKTSLEKKNKGRAKFRLLLEDAKKEDLTHS